MARMAPAARAYECRQHAAASRSRATRVQKCTAKVDCHREAAMQHADARQRASASPVAARTGNGGLRGGGGLNAVSPTLAALATAR